MAFLCKQLETNLETNREAWIKYKIRKVLWLKWITDYRDLSVSHGRKYKVKMRQDLTGENSGRRGKKEPVKDKEMVWI